MAHLTHQRDHDRVEVGSRRGRAGRKGCSLTVLGGVGRLRLTSKSRRGLAADKSFDSTTAQNLRQLVLSETNSQPR